MQKLTNSRLYDRCVLMLLVEFNHVLTLIHRLSNCAKAMNSTSHMKALQVQRPFEHFKMCDLMTP